MCAKNVTVTPAKKRLVVSYANMSAELAAAFKERYPKGYADYMADLIKVPKPDGSFFYAVSLEIPEAIYLIKIDVRVDDYEDVEKGLFNEEDDEDGVDTGDGGFPDDNTTSYADDEDSDE
ncbi:MAG: hypothetical protein IKV28_06675 [Bacteroidales bacterium]|nr:hypothetical protein [Bacteroidales bacterium]